jgi:hypothetical protein
VVIIVRVYRFPKILALGAPIFPGFFGLLPRNRPIRWVVFASLLALMVVAVARQWFDPPPFERDPLPFADSVYGEWEAFDADQRA